MKKTYTGDELNYVGFPLGGLGAGSFCVEGTGAFSAFSLKNEPDLNLEPPLFAAVTVKGETPVSRVIEGQVPEYKIFGGARGDLKRNPPKPAPSKGTGLYGTTYGLPRFREAAFSAAFPFAQVDFADSRFPLQVKLRAWSPFTPPEADDSSYPAAFLEYSFRNATASQQDAVFYYAAMNFLDTGCGQASVSKYKTGFLLRQSGTQEAPWEKSDYCALIDDSAARVNTALFRGGWFDSLTMLWNDIQAGKAEEKQREQQKDFPNPGGCLSLEFSLMPGEEKTIPVICCWYVPESSLRIARAEDDGAEEEIPLWKKERYSPWYAGRFASIEELCAYLVQNRARLLEASQKFSQAFFSSTLPPEVLEAVSANLSILKSPTILRQRDGRLWCWEGCDDAWGSCHGSCTHVWNYAQAICHLFPALERGLRQTEFFDSQAENGHQNFRSALPIGQTTHRFHAAADGQLGGIMKVYRDFRICGDVQWLRGLWGQVKASMDFCIQQWDKKREGVLKEPHHNTYDIEFWGADGMCSSFYLGALKAMTELCAVLGEDGSLYRELLQKGLAYLEEKLYSGEYFFQQVEWQDLEAKLPEPNQAALNDKISPEAAELMREYGPKYQYGTGCLSDGVLGFWLARMSGLGDVGDSGKIRSHLRSVYRYNLRESLLEHANPQRPGYALGDEAGLLLCTWPHGGKPALPFVYSDEVWTGIEYQVASHLIAMGEVEMGLDIVRKCRSRYTGRVRNPFDEYECGHWYARALASYALLEALTGIRYDAFEKTLYLSPKIDGDFSSFLATDTGYGLAGIRDGEPFLEVLHGSIDVQQIRRL